MSDPIDDGGPAFPLTGNYPKHLRQREDALGMSLRDYYATHALAGILASYAHLQSEGAVPVDENGALFCANGAFLYADAMLLARKMRTKTKL